MMRKPDGLKIEPSRWDCYNFGTITSVPLCLRERILFWDFPRISIATHASTNGSLMNHTYR